MVVCMRLFVHVYVQHILVCVCLCVCKGEIVGHCVHSSIHGCRQCPVPAFVCANFVDFCKDEVVSWCTCVFTPGHMHAKVHAFMYNMYEFECEWLCDSAA